MPRGVYKHKPLSEATKKKIALAGIGRRDSPETLAKKSAWQKGKYKTSKPKYGALHWRVRQKFGKANMCSSVLCDGTCKTYEWANVSQKYLNIFDFIQLCSRCHKAFDKAMGSKFGRPKKS